MHEDNSRSGIFQLPQAVWDFTLPITIFILGFLVIDLFISTCLMVDFSGWTVFTTILDKILTADLLIAVMAKSTKQKVFSFLFIFFEVVLN